MKTDFCLEYEKEAFEEYGVSAIFNTDCISQYTSAHIRHRFHRLIIKPQ